MQTARFGSTGVDVPLIGIGTWNMEIDSRTDAIAALQCALDVGMTHIDTAEMYGYGQVEEIVGEAIRGRRDEAFIVTKVLANNATHDKTIEACERSLGKLGIDVIDCYLLHWRGGVPLDDTFRAFEKLEQDGKIKSFGVSNFDVDDMQEAVEIVGEGRIACNQVLYHVLQRNIERELIGWCHDHDVAVVSYSPFGQGRFPKKSASEYKVLAEVAQARGMTPHQVALQFLIRHKSTFVIPKTSNVEHAKMNAAALDTELSTEELDHLAASFPPAKGGLPML